MNFRIPTKSKDLVQHLNGETHPLLNIICVFDEQERKRDREEKKNERRRRGEEEANPNTKASLLYQGKP